MPVLMNPSLDRTSAYGPTEQAVLSLEVFGEARQVISRWDGYRPTPLRRLPEIAAECGVAEILYKDESKRFGLKSFKALGGAYAVERLVAARGADGLVVSCATDGNHGRSVAWGARRFGAKAVIYVHEGVSQGRADAIAAFGADVIRAGAHYDESVRLAAEAADAHGWVIVSDTSWPGYEDIPRDVMSGYGLISAEAEEQGARPTHVFVQGGVGGLAASVLAYWWERHGTARPVVTVVEPIAADCLYRSAEAGARTVVHGDLDTIMAGLACGEPSMLAWTLLARGADAFQAIPDEAAADTMRALARLGVVGGESGVAGLAGLRALADDQAAREALGLTADSRVLVIGSEGATDPAVYRSIVGRSAEEVAP
jgi:diaminopropionate ammonia-lyase